MLGMMNRIKMARFGVLACLLFLFVVLFSPACGAPEGTCSKNGDCTDFAQECNPTTKKCEDIRCTTKDNCRNDWFCNPGTRKCQKDQPPECAANGDCSSNQKCENGKCVAKAECEADTDCSSNKTCDKGVCVDRTCKDALDCGDNTKFECKDGKCINKVIECQTKDDCKDPQKPECKDNKCVAKEGCDSNADCKDPAKPLCVARLCIAETGVKEGEKCEKAKNECKDGLVCHNIDTQQSEGICRASCFPFTPNCEKDRVCQQIAGNTGACVPSSGGKKLGEDCDKDKADSCEVNLACVTWKNKTTCAALCNPTNSSCASGEECLEFKKGFFYCVSEREPCGPGRPCDDTFVCVNGRCNPPPTCDTVECKADEVCEGGFCRAKKCPTEIQCKDGLNCDRDTGKCVTGGVDPPCNPCAAMAPLCAGTQECITGLGNGSEGFCFEDCSSGGTCTDSQNFECRTLNLTRSGINCTSDAQCQDARFKCDNGTCTRAAQLCIPKIGTCRNKCKGITCNAPQVCAPTVGQCILTGKKPCDICTVHDECGGKDDLCINYGSGDTRCGQDCRTQPCPSGFQCFELQGGAFKQCAPATLQCP